jgi:RNA polymerase sigma-B factor
MDQTSIEKIHQAYIENPNDENMELLTEACRGLILYYAKLYGGGHCFEDLCQSGYEGLLKAVHNFDEKLGVKFSTYSSHMIIGEIRHYVRKERKYYYPGYLKSYQNKLNDIVETSLADGDELIPEEELASMLNLRRESILPVMSAGLVHLGELEITRIKTKEPESFMLPVEDRLLLSQMMYHLTDIQKDVIVMLFHKGMTQAEVAKKLGLTQKQVSRIKLKSLQKMRKDTIE